MPSHPSRSYILPIRLHLLLLALIVFAMPMSANAEVVNEEWGKSYLVDGAAQSEEAAEADSGGEPQGAATAQKLVYPISSIPQGHGQALRLIPSVHLQRATRAPPQS